MASGPALFHTASLALGLKITGGTGLVKYLFLDSAMC